jgi:STE24 endopeptidase
MISEYLYWIILLFITVEFLFEQILERLQYKSYEYPIPDELKDIYSSEEIEKQKSYHKEYFRFETKHDFIFFILTIFVFAFQLPGKLDIWLRTFIDSDFLLTLTFFAIFGLIIFILGIPFQYYEIFIIEQKYGFNTSTIKTFVTDILKSIFLSIIIGIPLLYAIFNFYQFSGEYFWLYTWIVLTSFSLFITFFYSKLIVPLFNKQTPLPNGELKEAIMNFCKQVNFQVKDIYVLDASKRSKKANAYFTGFGKNKRIVLFDTLINQLSTEEIVAVLSHEIGHFKHKHILKSFLIITLQLALTMFILSLFIRNIELSKALGANVPSFHLGIIAFGILYSPFSSIISILLNHISRRNEQQADKYSVKYGQSANLISALKKLASVNYSHLTPHPLYVKIYYSHPPIKERINFMKNYESLDFVNRK